MISDPSNSRITIHVAEDHEDWFIHGPVAVQLTFPVPKIRIEDAGSLKKVIEPVIEQAEAAGYRWNPPHNYVMELRYGVTAYTSVHRSYQSARRKLTDCCADWGILNLLANSEMGEAGTLDIRIATGRETTNSPTASATSRSKTKRGETPRTTPNESRYCAQPTPSTLE